MEKGSIEGRDKTARKVIQLSGRGPIEGRIQLTGSRGKSPIEGRDQIEGWGLTVHLRRVASEEIDTCKISSPLDQKKQSRKTGGI